MADLNNIDKQPDGPAVPDKKRKPDVDLDEEADNVADFLEVHMLKDSIMGKLPELSHMTCVSMEILSHGQQPVWLT